MKVSKCINHERCEDLPSGLEIHGNSPSRCGYPRGYPSGCILYISCCIHGIPWNSMVHQAAKERRVRHFLHAPLAAHRAENSGSSGWNRRRGRTGGSMAWWRDRRTGIGEPWGSSHFLMGIQWLQIDKPCIALLNLLNSNGGNMRKRKCTGMYTAQDFTFHIGSESRVSKTRRWTLSNSPRWPRAAQTMWIDKLKWRGSGILRHPDSQLSWKLPACWQRLGTCAETWRRLWWQLDCWRFNTWWLKCLKIGYL